MQEDTQLRTQSYILARHQHAAWRLLLSPRAPLVLSCLQTLFEQSRDDILFDDALQMLASTLTQHANNDEFGSISDDPAGDARRELRSWIRRGLIVEREGRLVATDALQKALQFVDGLNDRIMTSTASRLATVQREIENLETRLNPDAQSRADHIKGRIKALEQELSEVEAGHFEVLRGAEAAEGIREVFNLATSLRADFRRVEDSYREADRTLRQFIVGEQHHRGEIVDKLLDGHDDLLETAEGQVFHGFYQQLGRSVELDNMKHRLRTILKHPAAGNALTRHQQDDLRWLVIRLVGESATVIRARARSERDVKGFLKTGLAAEHHRVGELLNEILGEALHVDWASHTVRKSDSSLPPVAISVSGLPSVDRLRFKSAEHDAKGELQLGEQAMSLNDIEDDFWRAFDGLNREALFQDTLQLLTVTDQAMSISDLASHLPPTHDLETVALWLSMVREADLPVNTSRESVEVTDYSGIKLRFDVPKVALTSDALKAIDREL